MGIERSYDASLMRNTILTCPTGHNDDVDCQKWLDDRRNVMFVSGDDVGLATYDHPGIYILHWFFVSRGRKALDVATAMVDKFLTEYDCKVITGLTPVSLKGACWMARKLGCKSYGIMDYHNAEPHELFIMTKDEFYRKNG
jgi:hypothetical protein